MNEAQTERTIELLKETRKLLAAQQKHMTTDNLTIDNPKPTVPPSIDNLAAVIKEIETQTGKTITEIESEIMWGVIAL